MGKTIPMTAKFTEEEADRIDTWAASKGLSRSAALHELVDRSFLMANTKTEDDQSAKNVVKFRFWKDFSYFWKDHDYMGFIRDDEAHISFGGEWKIYKLNEIPADVIRG